MRKNKKTIVHVIDNLARGGAETMLINLLKDMNSVYSIILVTLTDLNDFSNDEIICDERYCLNYKSKKDFPVAVFKLRNIIKKHSPVLVRSQLYWSTIISRFACPADIKLVFSIHSQLSKDAFSKNPFALLLEKGTYKKRHSVISVSKLALDDYKKTVKVKGKNFILHNFISPLYFNQSYDFLWQPLNTIKLVAVGNLKEAKNFEFLLNAIQVIAKDVSVTLDIIGEGHLRNHLQKIIDAKHLPVKLLGRKKNVDELLPGYTAFIMCSKYEGFGNAPVEAMAVGLPLILNDLEVMKEMSANNALFYKSENIQSLTDLFINFPTYLSVLKSLSISGKQIAKDNYSKEHYFKRLQSIYENIINE